MPKRAPLGSQTKTGSLDRKPLADGAAEREQDLPDRHSNRAGTGQEPYGIQNVD